MIESNITIFNPKLILLLRFYLLKPNLNYSRNHQREALSEPPCDPSAKLAEVYIAEVDPTHGRTQTHGRPCVCVVSGR